MTRSFYITGGWGYGNRGDNAIFEGMRQSFKEHFPSARLTITSYSTVEMKEQHDISAIKSVHRLLGKRSPLGLFRWLGVILWRISGLRLLLVPSLRRHRALMKDASAVVMGGGGYFNDAWPDMLRSRYVEIDLARSVGTPIVIYGQTVGPFSQQTIQKSLKRYLGYVSRIAYRDAQSLKVLEAAGVPATRRVLSADEANLLAVRPAVMARRPGRLLIGVMAQKFRPHLGPSGPSDPGSIPDEQTYIQRIAEALLSLADAHPEIDYVFIPSTRWDEPVVAEVARRVSDALAERVTMVNDPDAHHFISLCQNVDLMISTNMHPVILAATASVPSIAISYHYKLDDYMAAVGQGDAIVRIDDFNSESLGKDLRRVFDARLQGAEVLRARCKVIRVMAGKNISTVVELLEKDRHDF
ncbi:MAG: polysaccharide pyruvyl transferase family protein [Methyloversatilis sp.]|uniref:polysaccharide pyruvyl transferase family protein n=1 Tax=Methyloversatilis sp. TaxID=2569862 RepID=UPI002735B11F|nr:polysaccharide pyruvyl transferase family protein [Methyloversatilis sp.]MDP3873733.1 polysaccharide pyruvyl transferase family protein [Methyloversatilis sp.]